MNNCIGIIPARGGSKGIPNKNLTNINGKPLIYYTIKAALESKIEKVYVSTDDQAIMDYAVSLGASAIMRPDNISGDHSPSEDALIHALNLLDNVCTVAFLQCTSPLVRGSHINQGLREFKEKNLDSLFSAVDAKDLFIWRSSRAKVSSISYDWKNRARRQDCKDNVLETGSFYIFKPHVLLENKNRLGGKIGFTLLPDHTKHEIDLPEDIPLVADLLKKHHTS